MKDEEREQVTARPLKETVRKLTDGAKQRNLHPTTYYAMILDKASKFEVKTGVIIIDKAILQAMYGDLSKVEYTSREQAERKFEEWRISEEEISRDNFERRLREWNSLSSMHVKVSENNESIIYDVNHGIDEQWSKFQCLMNVEILKLMGETKGL